VARGAIARAEPFGVYVAVDGRPTYASWSDHAANELDPALVKASGAPLVGDGDPVTAESGHLLRFFEARDAAGAIPGVYLAFQDYPARLNYDFNDHVFLIRNVTPHALTAAEDSGGDGVNDALQRDLDGDGRVAFFDPGDAPRRIEAEDFTLVQGFRVQGRAAASGGANIEAVGADEQAARWTFAGRDGVYDLGIGHFDETDGAARLSVLVDGGLADAWTWGSGSGSPLPDALSRAVRAIEGVVLRAGDTIELRGFAATGEPLRVDFVDLAFREPLAIQRIEAESMALAQGFRVQARSAASGGANIEAAGAGLQAARHVFGGPAGIYDLDIGHFDETDGVARMAVSRNGVQIDGWLWDQDTGSATPTAAALRVRRVEDVALDPGDVIELSGFADGGEILRTDFLDFVRTGDLFV
jgi:hypothetical protein